MSYVAAMLRDVCTVGFAVLIATACRGRDGASPADGDGSSSGAWLPTSSIGGIDATTAATSEGGDVPDVATDLPPAPTPLTIVVHSEHAQRIDVFVYAEPFGAPEVLSRQLDRKGDAFTTTLAAEELAAVGVGDVVYYGLRAWGPNWPYDPRWTPGSDIGFVADVDDDGNRFDPNKLLFDPRARELSHDPTTPSFGDHDVYRTGAENRTRDSGPWAPKSVHLLAGFGGDPGAHPARALADDVVYEVHVRGFTEADPSVEEACRGTYAGVAAKADYLADLGVTAIELLPVHETQNANNDIEQSASGDNYWGYSTLGFFAPDRRYACDDTPGGPTREFREMVAALHERDIKVVLDVVYNHTAEAGVGNPDRATLYSLRGLDNAAYYEIDAEPGKFADNTGTGANTNAKHPLFRDLVLDSLHYWHNEMGVDGFRFDLAAVLANDCLRDCFDYVPDDPDNILQRAVAELPARGADGGPGADLIAEPWGIGAGTYQLGNFPIGWSEWNGVFRDTVRRDMNKLGVENVTPRELVRVLAGSPQLFDDGGRSPAAAINYVVSHDGFTLHDVFACENKRNDQPWPYGPSGGGENNNLSSDNGGDPIRQRQAARTALALLVTAAGVPMITGGDEMLRSVACNNNPYNLDSVGNWLDWSLAAEHPAYAAFARGMLRWRRDHPALHARAWQGAVPPGWSFQTDAGVSPSDGYLDDPTRHFLGWTIDGRPTGDSARTIYVGYNGWSGTVVASLPEPAAGYRWVRVADTSAAQEADAFAEPGSEPTISGGTYAVDGRSVLIAMELPR